MLLVNCTLTVSASGVISQMHVNASRSTLDLSEQRLELNSSGTMSILCKQSKVSRISSLMHKILRYNNQAIQTSDIIVHQLSLRTLDFISFAG